MDYTELELLLKSPSDEELNEALEDLNDVLKYAYND